MSKFRRILMEANEVAARLERLNKRIGKVIVDALRSEIADIMQCDGAPNCIVLDAPSYSGYWNTKLYLQGDLVPLHTILWEVEDVLFDGNQHFFLTAPNGIFLPKDKARRVREILLDLLHNSDADED